MWLIIPVALGLLLAFFPVEAVAVVMGAMALPLALLFPEYVILLMVVLLSSIVFEEDLPLLPVAGIGSLHITDVLLLFLLAKVCYLTLFSKEYKMAVSPLITPLMLFFSMTVFATVNSISFAGADLNTVIRETRGLSYYLVFLVVVGLFRKEKQIDLLAKGLLAIGAFVALAMLAQALVGPSLQLMPGRIEAAGTFGSDYGALRILPPGQTLVYMLFITTLCRMILVPRWNVLNAALAALFAAGVMLTYNRVYWVSTILAVIVLFLISKGEEAKRVVVVVSLVAAVLVGTLAGFNFLGGKYAEAAASFGERFVSVFAGSKLVQSNQVEDRVTENRFAMEAIGKSPLIGSGLHSNYRPAIYGEKDTLTFYVHNAYLWFVKDMGVVGLAFFMWFFAGYVARGIRKVNSIQDHSRRATLAGFTLSGLGIIPMSLVNPVYMQWFSIVCIAVTAGLCEMIIYTNETGTKEVAAPEP